MPVVHEIKDDVSLELPDDEGSVSFRAHWQIFVPTIVILISYGLSMLYLWATNRVDTNLFRLFAIVAAVGVPLLAAHAFLRFETVRVKLLKNAIQYHPGWPKHMAQEIPMELIEILKVKRGLAGRLMGGGTLIIHTSTGSKIAIADLKDPDKILELADLT